MNDEECVLEFKKFLKYTGNGINMTPAQTKFDIRRQRFITTQNHYKFSLRSRQIVKDLNV
mgnify:FL=1